MTLLVEDEAITRSAFADALRMEGEEVIQAANGMRALSVLDKSHVDLVITDLAIPKLTGFDLVTNPLKVAPYTDTHHFRVYLAGRSKNFRWKR